MHKNITPMGNIVRSAREAKGMTQAALAKKIAVSHKTVVELEKIGGSPHLKYSAGLSTPWIFQPI